jgi:DUF971 family protein
MIIPIKEKQLGPLKNIPPVLLLIHEKFTFELRKHMSSVIKVC